MTGGNIEDFDIENHIRDLQYHDDTPDFARTLVAGNLRNLYGILKMRNLLMKKATAQDRHALKEMK